MKRLTVLILSIFIFGFTHTPVVKLGKWTPETLNNLIRETKQIDSTGEQIAYISEHFINTPYKVKTLIGDSNTPEKLVLNLSEMDCMTFIEYVEAIRNSRSYKDLLKKLAIVRYCKSDVNYKTRRHFFTDWSQGDKPVAKDITASLPGSISVEKILNHKSDTESWLKNIPQRKRVVTYLPADNIKDKAVNMLKTGDYIGIYADMDGLDVTHTGILIKKAEGIFIRNASSRKQNRRVVDYPFSEYIKNISGIIVLRAE
jgi:ribosomal protein S8